MVKPAAPALPGLGVANCADLAGNLVLDLVGGDAVWRPIGAWSERGRTSL